ncbi:MAG TPA: hypothetical protein VN742_07395 [Candidatus Binataceae bacterium]|nr:hypothetical protein [Candidatus Binataceae bacterium]
MSTNNELHVLQIQHDALRAEIMEKMRVSHQLGHYKLLSLGAMLSLAVTSAVHPEYLHPFFLIVILLPVAFDAELYFNGKSMVKVGHYVRDHIEPHLTALAGYQKDFVLWETYIDPPGEGQTMTRADTNSAAQQSRRIHLPRLFWNLYEAVQPALTLALQCFLLRYILEIKNSLATGLAIVAMGIEATILVLAVLRK